MLSSQLKVLSPPPEGRASLPLPLYDWVLVAGSVCCALAPQNEWAQVEEMLFKALLGLPVHEKIIESSPEKEYDSEEDFFEDFPSEKKEKGANISSTSASDASRSGWFWPHLFASDLLAFCARCI